MSGPFKPTAHTRCANSARQRPVKDLTPLQPIVSSSPLTARYILGLNIGPMRFRPVTVHLMDGPIFRMYIFRPFSDPFKCWANFRPGVSFSLLTAHKSDVPFVVGPEFQPFSGPFKCWANFWPGVTFSLLTAHKSVGPFVVGPEFWPFSDPFKCWANSRPCVPFGLLTDHK